jgi:hypothetical protein
MGSSQPYAGEQKVLWQTLITGKAKLRFERMAGQMPAMMGSLAGQNNWRMHV